MISESSMQDEVAFLDVRELLLYKYTASSDDTRGHRHLPARDDISSGPYVVLGDYDAMAVRKVVKCANEYHIWESVHRQAEQSLLSLDGNSYLHLLSVYATSGCEHRSKNLLMDEFWANTTSPLLFATLANVDSAEENIDDSMAKVSKILNALRGEVKKDEVAIFDFCCYASIDSCDFVIFWKSSKIQPVVQALASLLSKNEAEYQDGDMSPNTVQLLKSAYTICGFDDALLEKEAKDRIWTETFIGENVDFLANVKSFSDFKKMLPVFGKVLGMDQYSTPELLVLAGDVDAYIQHNKPEITASDLIEMQKLRTGLSGDRISDYPEIRTRIAIPYAEPVQTLSFISNSTIDREWIKKGAHDLLTSFKKYLSNSQNHCCATTILSLLNSMCLSADDCMRDDVFMLCYRPLKVFLEYFRKYEENTFACDNETTSDHIHRYLRGLHSVLTNATRTSAELAQFPGHSTMLFDLPAKLNLFYQAFLSEVTEFLEMGDTIQYRPCFFLVPEQSHLCMTQEVFTFSPPMDRKLLLTDVPAQMLYDPKALLIELVHESAHYAAAYSRKHLERASCYVAMMLQSILQRLGLYDDENAAAFEYALKMIDTELHQKLGGECIYYQDNMTKDVYDAILEHLSSPGELSKLVRSFCGEATFDTIQDTYNNAFKEYPMLFMQPPTIQDLLGLYYDLIKECYADIVMIYTLDITLKDYLRSFERTALTEDMFDNPRDYPFIWERPVVIYKLMLDSHMDDTKWNLEMIEPNDPLYRISQIVSEYSTTDPYDEKTGEAIKKKYFYNRNVRIYLLNYLQACLVSLSEGNFEAEAKKKDEREQERKRIQARFNDILNDENPGIMYTAFYTTIRHYVDGLKRQIAEG